MFIFGLSVTVFSKVLPRLRTGRPGFGSQQGLVFFLPVTAVSRLALGPTQPPVQWVPGLNWPGRVAGHSPLSIGEVKNV
jgi:hypothetical protein